MKSLSRGIHTRIYIDNSEGANVYILPKLQIYIHLLHQEKGVHTCLVIEDNRIKKNFDAAMWK